MNSYKPISPGKALKMYFEGEKIKDIAEKLEISRVNLSKILNDHRAISPKMAIKLSEVFKTEPEYWLNISNKYEIWKIKNGKDE